MTPRNTPPRALVVALVLASVSLMTLDAGTDDGSALEPARRAVGEVFGPIEAGTTAVIRPITEVPGWFRDHADMTVINNDGLVGRILRVTRTTATVLLIIDRDSTVGGRIGNTMDLGFLTGRGETGDEAGLDLRLVDQSVVPARDTTVVTWGSDGEGPYVAGVPIGRVTEVFSDLRDSSQRAEIEPFVDFAKLDLVGVVVPRGTESDRGLIEADGSLER